MLARRMDRLCVADFICRSLSYAYYTKKTARAAATAKAWSWRVGVREMSWRVELELESGIGDLSLSWRAELESGVGIGDLRTICGNS